MPVYIAMALVTAAAGVGMSLQLGLAGWLSIVAALSLFMTMFALHQLGRRGAEIADLRQQVMRLENEMRRAPPRGAGAPLPPLATAPLAATPASTAPFSTAPAAAAAAPPPLSQPARTTRVEAALRGPQADAGARSDVMRSEALRGERPAPSLTPPPMPAAGPAPIASTATEAQRDPWSLRPGDSHTPPPLAAQPSAAAVGGVRDSDVEVIQGLIKKLADEVNGAPEPPQAAARAPAPAQQRANPDLTQSAIENSLEALRSTAMTMRERDEAAGMAKRRAQPQPEPQPRPAATARRQADAPPPAAARSAAPRPTPVPPPVATVAPPVAPPPVAKPAMAPAAAATPPPMPRAVEPDIDTGDAWLDADAAGSFVDPRLAALREAITAQRADVYLEPILTLVDQRPRHYEVQVRPRTADGSAIADDADLHTLLDGSGLLPVLDRTRIARVAGIARRLAERGRDSSIFSGFSSESLIDDEFLNDFANAFHERDSFASQLVLTFSLADVRAVTPRERASLEDMRDLGFRFAIDHVTDLDVDFEDLRRNGFQFVKLDADVFLQGLPASGGLIPAADICRHLTQVGMTLIVGDIADEAKFARIYGFGVLFGQGQLFGGPRLVKAEPAPQRRTAAA